MSLGTLAFLSLSFGEMLVVAVVALLVFGGRLPDVMRNLGKSYARFRRGLEEAARPIRQELGRLDVRPPSFSVPSTSGPPVRPAPGATPSPLPPGAPPPYAPDRPSPPPERPPSSPAYGGVGDEPPPV